MWGIHFSRLGVRCNIFAIPSRPFLSVAFNVIPRLAFHLFLSVFSSPCDLFLLSITTHSRYYCILFGFFTYIYFDILEPGFFVRLFLSVFSLCPRFIHPSSPPPLTPSIIAFRFRDLVLTLKTYSFQLVNLEFDFLHFYQFFSLSCFSFTPLQRRFLSLLSYPASWISCAFYTISFRCFGIASLTFPSILSSFSWFILALHRYSIPLSSYPSLCVRQSLYLFSFLSLFSSHSLHNISHQCIIFLVVYSLSLSLIITLYISFSYFSFYFFRLAFNSFLSMFSSRLASLFHPLTIQYFISLV